MKIPNSAGRAAVTNFAGPQVGVATSASELFAQTGEKGA
jgi:hypothetical protein